jgi:uncharacterized membrane protein YgcG
MTRVAFSAREVGRAGATLVGIGQLLEEYAAECSPGPSAGLSERIVSAISREQPPTPPVLLLRSLRERSLTDAARYLAGSLQAAVGAQRSFPLAVRAQAIAIVLVAVIILGGGGVALAAGAAGLAQALAPVLAPRAAPAVQQSRPAAAPGFSHVRRAPHHKVKPDHVPPAKGKPDDPGRGGNKHEGSGGGRSSGKGGSDDTDTSGLNSSGSGATHSIARPKRSAGES